MYDRELIETKKKVDKILARRTQEYQQGYQDGGSDMEQAKQIIIDSLLKQIEQIRADAIDEFVKELLPRLTDAIYSKDVPSMTNLIVEVAGEVKEQNK